MFDYISAQSLESVAYTLILLWLSAPLIVMISQIFAVKTDFFDAINSLYVKIIIWDRILHIVGYVGLVLGLITLIKYIYKAKENQADIFKMLSKHKMPLFLAAFVVWGLFSSLFSSDKTLSFIGDGFRRESLQTLLSYLGIFSCGYIIYQKKHIINVIFWFVMSAAFLSIISLININYINRLFNISAVTSIFNNSNHFGYFLCMSIIACLFLIMNAGQTKYRLMWVIIFGILTAALIQNGSFGPFIAALGGLLCSLFIAILVDKTKIKIQLITLAIFIIVTIFMNFLTSSIAMDLLKLLFDINAIAQNTTDAGSSGSGRWRIWVLGVQFVSERPLFGYGLNNLADQYARFQIEMAQPHNEFIQYAATMGIPALIFYTSAIISHLARFWKTRKILSTLSISVFCIVIAYLVNSLFGCSLYYTAPYFFMFLGLSGQLQILDSK